MRGELEYVSVKIDNIKPCPFCGERKDDGLVLICISSKEGGIWMMELPCGRCGCVYELGKYKGDRTQDQLIDLLIEQWNRRPEPTHD